MNPANTKPLFVEIFDVQGVGTYFYGLSVTLEDVQGVGTYFLWTFFDSRGFTLLS